MNISCETAKDLIPLCVDGTASQISIDCVKQHIKHCKECKEYYKECKADLEAKSSHNDQNAPFSVKNSYTELSKRMRRNRNLRITSICILAVLCIGYIIKDIYNIVHSVKK